MRRGTVVVIVVVVAAALVVALGPRMGGRARATPVSSLEEVIGTWEATSAPDAPTDLSAPVRLVVVEGGLFVETGCNTARGPAHVEDSRLVVEALAATRRACVPPLDTQEQWVLEMLDSRPVLQHSGSALVFQWGDSGQYLLELLPAQDVSPSPSSV